MSGQGVLPRLYYLAGSPSLGHPTPDDPLDPVLGHEIQPSRVTADYWLPAFDGEVDRPGDEGDLFQVVAPVGDVDRDVIVLAVVGEGLFIESLEDDVDLFFEEVSVGFLVKEWVAEHLNFPGVVAPTHPEDHPTPGQHVGGGVVLGEAQGMPHGRDVEPRPYLQLLCDAGQVHGQHEDVGDALVALSLEVVLGEPQGVVAQVVHEPCHVDRAVKRGDEVIVGVESFIDRGR